MQIASGPSRQKAKLIPRRFGRAVAVWWRYRRDVSSLDIFRMSLYDAGGSKALLMEAQNSILRQSHIR